MASKADKATAARASAVAKLGKRLDRDATPHALEAIGRGLAGWRVAHTDGSAAILVRDEAPAPPEQATGAFWAWVQAPAYCLEAVPESAALGPAVRFITAAARGQHRASEAISVAWSIIGGRLTLHYVRPGCDCEEAIAAIPLRSLDALIGPGEDEAAITRGCLDGAYLFPTCDPVHVDGWTWCVGEIAGVPVVELRADDLRVVICGLKDGK